MVVITRLRLRPPGAEWITVTDGSTTATAINNLTVTWSRPSGLSHADPGTIHATIRTPAGDPAPWAAWDAELVAEISLDDGTTWTTVARGWLTRIQRRTINRDTPREAWVYDLDAEDILGRAAATKLAADPWPSESALNRAAHINEASTVAGAGQLITWTAPGFNTAFPGTRHVAARDVDNIAALDVIRRTVAPEYAAHETATGIAGRKPSGGTHTVLATDGYYLRVHTALASPVTDIPANAIEDTGRLLDRASRLDTAVIAFFVYDTTNGYTETSLTLTAPSRLGSSSSHRITTDHLNLHTSVGATLRATLTGLLTESATPVYRLPGAPTIAADRVPPADLLQLVNIDTRGPMSVHIANNTADVESLNAVTAGTLTIRGRDISLELALKPSRLDGIRPLAISEARNPTGGQDRAVFRRPSTTIPTTFRDTLATVIA